mmetsp:Transcript_5765/g.21795  ORF Transcript_5765/g.21795 Transcript_5765/m.21795 type:complete len:291 (+) Transcript_5765:276-1148(+)
MTRHGPTRPLRCRGFVNQHRPRFSPRTIPGFVFANFSFFWKLSNRRWRRCRREYRPAGPRRIFHGSSSARSIKPGPCSKDRRQGWRRPVFGNFWVCRKSRRFWPRETPSRASPLRPQTLLPVPSPGTPGLSQELFRPPHPTRKKPHASRPGFRTRFQNRGAHHVFRHRRPRRVSPAPPANPAPRAYTSAPASRTPPAGRAVVCFFPPARGTRSLPRLLGPRMIRRQTASPDPPRPPPVRPCAPNPDPAFSAFQARSPCPATERTRRSVPVAHRWLCPVSSWPGPRRTSPL